jgi:hypothetical protein
MSSDLRTKAQSLRAAMPERNRPKPPPENGRLLANIPRSNDEELHVCWCEYEGKPYLSLRIWERSRDGSLWPSKTKGMSVRIRELPEFAEALAEALELAESEVSSRRQQRPSAGDRRPSRPADQDFDEFESN